MRVSDNRLWELLIVDDEKEIADLIELYLKNDGYKVYKFYNGTDALKCVGSEKMDLAILDVMLPDINGFRSCQCGQAYPCIAEICGDGCRAKKE